MKPDVHKYNSLLGDEQTRNDASDTKTSTNRRFMFITVIFIGTCYSYYYFFWPQRNLMYEGAHTKSLAESNGWFDVSDEKWKKIKELHFKTRYNQVNILNELIPRD